MAAPVLAERGAAVFVVGGMRVYCGTPLLTCPPQRSSGSTGGGRGIYSATTSAMAAIVSGSQDFSGS